ncbi:hypothetical protein GOARA_027_00440 [Gordonia araii NBRC 100433]|uniref:Uncharacterized protein n=1 Tax=Gordonia araii NBRC 100433 TaxID=1073574 RepID=G7GZQ6_9ACTN|nr:hypothetical protein [Gordonia araii]NNG98857.1 hypothetical protein [Gordonia araii NBRC 100433]GAB09081.1 hypothetical protein GOARA_027_00440 [Gordonia araii NBRC 100433]
MGQYKAWVTGNWMAIRDRSNRHRIRPTRSGGEIVGPRVRYVFRKAARGYTGEVYQNGAFTNQLTLIRR